MAVTVANDDLIWDIGNIRQPGLAERFIRGLQNNLSAMPALDGTRIERLITRHLEMLG